MWKCNKCQKPVFFGECHSSTKQSADIPALDISIFCNFSALDFNCQCFQLNVNSPWDSTGTPNVSDAMNAESD